MLRSLKARRRSSVSKAEAKQAEQKIELIEAAQRHQQRQQQQQRIRNSNNNSRDGSNSSRESRSNDGSSSTNNNELLPLQPHRHASHVTDGTAGLDHSSESTMTPETATLSMSNDHIIEECPIAPPLYNAIDNAAAAAVDEQSFMMTPADGVSEIVLEDILQRRLKFDTHSQQQLPATVDEDSIYTQSGSPLFHGDNDGSPYYASSTVVAFASPEQHDYHGEASVNTEQSVAFSAADTISTMQPDCHRILLQQQQQQHHESRSAREEETTCLVTFQRDVDKASTNTQQKTTTTLHARRSQDTMADLVRRLQKSTSGGVLTFGKKELKKLQKGSRQIVFILPQCQGASFAKDEFGQMTVADMMKLTPVRPIVVQVSLERTVSGEQIDIF